ncbi:MAG: molybdopterin molybdotransferase MoeA [Bacteriovoracaceae bacterium]|nr:molybdopterin molybdotransferase MoeA [Bacteriovoracaceae bacterium]
MEMISSDMAFHEIMDRQIVLGKKACSVFDSLGQVLSCDVFYENNGPSFDRVAMDGVAINFQQRIAGNLTTHKIEAVQRAGTEKLTLKHHGCAIEVMTGAILPNGVDTVIPYERCTIESGSVSFDPQYDLNMGSNVHRKGSDFKKGDLCLKRSSPISAPMIGTIVSQGVSELDVVRTPSICVVSTGDELVELDATPFEHQLRRSNPYAIRSVLSDYGIKNVELSHIVDDKEILYEKLGAIISDHDVTIITGGVSMGKFDFIPQILSDLKVEKVFHKIKQKPGKPMWYGVNASGAQVFGLPGNPISSLVCLIRYVAPALLKVSGHGYHQRFVKLSQKMSFKKEMTYFPPVIVNIDDHGQLWATPIEFNGSGDYASLSHSSGVVELCSHKEHFEKGSVVPIFLWRKNL